EDDKDGTHAEIAQATDPLLHGLGLGREPRIECLADLSERGIVLHMPLLSHDDSTPAARAWASHRLNRLWLPALLTLKVPKHTGPRDAVLLHERRDRHAAAVFIPQRADLAGREGALAGEVVKLSV